MDFPIPDTVLLVLVLWLFSLLCSFYAGTWITWVAVERIIDRWRDE